MVFPPMIKGAQEAVFSMGDDIPLAILSTYPRLLYTYFKQRFAQVTNPPIDSLLERLVKSLTPLFKDRPDVRAHLAAMHEELGRLWSDSPFARPDRAIENWRRLAELERGRGIDR